MPGVSTTPRREQPLVERRDRGDADVLAHVEERRDHFDPLALLEEQLGGRERLLRCARRRPRPRSRPPWLRRTARRDPSRRACRRCPEPAGRRDAIRSRRRRHRGAPPAPPTPSPPTASRTSTASFRTWAARKRTMPAYSARAGASREQHLTAQLGRLLEQHDAMAPERRHSRRLQPGHAAADHHDLLGRCRRDEPRRARRSRPVAGFWTHVTGLPW